MAVVRVQVVLLTRHSARSRGIQEPRAQSTLQAFLDAATARSMTGVCVQHDRLLLLLLLSLLLLLCSSHFPLSRLPLSVRKACAPPKVSLGIYRILSASAYASMPGAKAQALARHRGPGQMQTG